MTRTELIIQLLKLVIGLAFGAYFVWGSLQVLDRLTPEESTLRFEGFVLSKGEVVGEATREAAMAAFAKS